MDRRAFLGLCAGAVVVPKLVASRDVPFHVSGSWVSAVVLPDNPYLTPAYRRYLESQGYVFDRFRREEGAFVLPADADIDYVFWSEGVESDVVEVMSRA